MTNNKLLSINKLNQLELEAHIQTLQKDLDQIQEETTAFENTLRTHLSDLIIESKELTILYKQLKKQKKAKRLEQKKRGKNYIEPPGIKRPPKVDKSTITDEEQKEKKRLYREAIFHVHPDKFSMNDADSDVATEITTRLIEIYHNGSLETLQAYHAHIFNGSTHIKLDQITVSKIQTSDTANYLVQEKERLQKELELAKNQHLYKVLKEYDNPLTFVDELKEYYEDRIFKMRKRTRKGV